jgi:hypothetical protein
MLQATPAESKKEFALCKVYRERLCLAWQRSRKKAHNLSLLAVTMTGLYRP